MSESIGLPGYKDRKQETLSRTTLDHAVPRGAPPNCCQTRRRPSQSLSFSFLRTRDYSRRPRRPKVSNYGNRGLRCCTTLETTLAPLGLVSVVHVGRAGARMVVCRRRSFSSDVRLRIAPSRSRAPAPLLTFARRQWPGQMASLAI